MVQNIKTYKEISRYLNTKENSCQPIIIDKNINMYWSDYKAFNIFTNNIFNIITKFE